MKLRNIALSLYGHPKEWSSPFSFETRSLCNYVQRHARSLKIEARGFNQIVVLDDPFSNAANEPRIVSEKTLAVPFRLDLSRYQHASPEQKQNYFAEILRAGLHRANEFQPIPLDNLLRKVEEFRLSGFHNRWIHQSKSLRSHGLTAELQCELTMEEFRLTLEVRRRVGHPVRLAILSTKPDETCFHHKFKDLMVRGDHLVVTSCMHTNDALVRFPLSRFSEPEA